MSNQPQPTKERRIDLGAQVGIARNLAFAKGGRTYRLTDGAYNMPRPEYSALLHQLLLPGQSTPALAAGAPS